MEVTCNPLGSALLEQWQRDFPLVSRPFAEIARRHLVTESDVIACFERLKAQEAISRVGGIVRPNTLGASTLAAMSAPPERADAIGAILSAEPGINHVYLRENSWNLWFVVTGPDRTYVDAVREKMRRLTDHHILDLKLERPFHIDLGFSLGASVSQPKPYRIGAVAPKPYAAEPGDRRLVQMLTSGLPIMPQPFREAARQLGTSEDALLERARALLDAGVVTRIGAIVRHHTLGWRSNAMVVWDVDPDAVEAAGLVLSRVPGINLCYRRTRYEGHWPYNLYCMVHARSREDAFGVIETATEAAGLAMSPRQVLFSSKCYKQTGAMVVQPKEAA